MAEHLLNQYLDYLDSDKETEEQTLWEFFGGDYELFQECEKEKDKKENVYSKSV